jgi:hypothetical protein
MKVGEGLEKGYLERTPTRPIKSYAVITYIKD